MMKYILVLFMFVGSIYANDIIIDTSKMDQFLKDVDKASNKDKNIQEEIRELNNRHRKEQKESELGTYDKKNISKRVESLKNYFNTKIGFSNRNFIAFPNYTYFEECNKSKCIASINISQKFLDNAIDAIDKKEYYKDQLAKLKIIENMHPLKDRVRFLSNMERTFTADLKAKRKGNNSKNNNNLLTFYDNQMYKDKVIKIYKNRVVLK